MATNGHEAPTRRRVVPPGSCDTHVHVFDPAHHPYAPARTYTPGEASTASLVRMHQALGIERAVLVQPSVYGTDNACLLAALAHLGPARARGVAVVEDASPGDDALECLHAAGVRGIRLNIEVAGAGSPDALRSRLKAVSWLREMPGWHLQLHAGIGLTLSLLDDLADLGTPVVLDHFAGLHKQSPDAMPDWTRLLAFLRHGPGYVKLSAPYRRHAARDDDSMKHLATALAEAAPGRVLWGSDWPHTGGEAGGPRDPSRVEPFRTIDNAAVLAALAQALGAPGLSRMLVDNPQELYGFTAPVKSPD